MPFSDPEKRRAYQRQKARAVYAASTPNPAKLVRVLDQDPKKVAARGRARGRYWANREVYIARAAAWKTANKTRKQEHTRRYNLSKYGITPEEYDAAFAAQNGVCAVCGDSPEPGKNLCVDHCHNTTVVRGLLCTGCNSGLGHFRDRPAALRAAAAYLEKDQ